MTDSEKLDYLVENAGFLAQETAGLRREVEGLKDRMISLERNVGESKEDVERLRKNILLGEEGTKSSGEKGENLERSMVLSEKKVASLEQEIAAFKQDVADIRMYQQEVLLSSLKRVAEGHVDLNKKLNDAWQYSMEEKMQYLRLNVLEWEIKCIKEKLALA